MPGKTGGPPPPVVVPVVFHESLTDLSGLVYGVRIGPTFGVSYFTLSRNVDGLSPQFAAALASGSSLTFPSVTIHTVSGHVVKMSTAFVDGITKAGQRVPDYPGSYPLVRPGMQAITWKGSGGILVDGVWQFSYYNWLGLNS